MSKNGPIIVLDDDADDQEIMLDIFKRIGCKNEIVFFSEDKSLIEYLEKPANRPFLIISDLNIPGVNCFELRDKVMALTSSISRPIPYLFFTTGSFRQQVVQAYSSSAQGFFIKPDNLGALEKTLQTIITYWQTSITYDHYK